MDLRENRFDVESSTSYWSWMTTKDSRGLCFVKSKSETVDVLMIFLKMIQTNINYLIAEIRCDHGNEFEK